MAAAIEPKASYAMYWPLDAGTWRTESGGMAGGGGGGDGDGGGLVDDAVFVVLLSAGGVSDETSVFKRTRSLVSFSRHWSSSLAAALGVGLADEGRGVSGGPAEVPGT